MRRDPGILFARWLLASVFVVMGAYRLMAAAQGAAIPNSTLVFSAVELVLGLLIAIGWRVRWTAILAALLMLADALLSHKFWALHGPERGAQLLHFMKNVNIVGGFLLLALVSGNKQRRL
ncbi:DoxX family protein [Luteimonas sp. SX5]|uniref:DoxX family protein n=1 Tax=Luteimonas galliterrae TaxID=2940486 RepID=A0ABT0ME12_9GAMM|nr:DoxX family protein [Luteimonas galliterrae]MCL1633108.1 DoxX family protein [Luteimonas galliterrae]